MTTTPGDNRGANSNGRRTVLRADHDRTRVEIRDESRSVLAGTAANCEQGLRCERSIRVSGQDLFAGLGDDHAS